MAWIKVGSEFPKHKKVMLAGARLGRYGAGRVIAIWTVGMGYVNSPEIMSGGFIPRDVVASFTVYDRDPIQVAEAISSLVTDVEAQQWGFRVSDDPATRRLLWIAEEGGYRVHSYHDYNGVAVDLHEKRQRSGRLGGLASGKVRREANEANQQAKTKQREQQNSERNRSENRSPGTGTYLLLRSKTDRSTARLAPSDTPSAVEKSNAGRHATPWLRVCAIVHTAIETLADPLDLTEEVKSQCARQGIAYGDRDRSGRPLFARAIDYVRAQRARRAS